MRPLLEIIDTTNEPNILGVEPKIEDKPIYCSAWVSKVSDKVMCNTIPCCGFCLDGRKIGEKYKSLKGKPLHETIGRHPLVDGKFVFNDGTVHKQKTKV